MRSFTVQPFDKKVYLTSDPAEFTRRYNLYASTEPMTESELKGCRGMAAHVVRDDKAPHALFLLYLPQDYDVSTVFHEALHMAHFLMDYTGMPIDMESTELQAYTMEYIAGQVFKRLSSAPPKGTAASVGC